MNNESIKNIELSCECRAVEIVFLPCARKTIEHAGLTVNDWICITEESFEKGHQFKEAPESINLIARRTKESLARPLGATG